MKKLVVPKEMAVAYQDAVARNPSTFAGLEAALRWLDGKLEEMCQTNHYDGKLGSHASMVEIWREGVGDVRQMFNAPEPEVPESIKDLRKMMADYFNHSFGCSYPDDLLVEAYRRGLAYAKRPAP